MAKRKEVEFKTVDEYKKYYAKPKKEKHSRKSKFYNIGVESIKMAIEQLS